MNFVARPRPQGQGNTVHSTGVSPVLRHLFWNYSNSPNGSRKKILAFLSFAERCDKEGKNVVKTGLEIMRHYR